LKVSKPTCIATLRNEPIDTYVAMTVYYTWDSLQILASHRQWNCCNL